MGQSGRFQSCQKVWDPDLDKCGAAIPPGGAGDGRVSEAYALVIAAAGAYGDAGIIGSILAALAFAVPMGF